MLHLHIWEVHVAKAIISMYKVSDPVLLKASKCLLGTLRHRYLHSSQS